LTNLSTDLTASATKYPSVNAVIAGLATKQPLDADLTAIAALAGTSGFLIKTAADTWALDTSTYLTTTVAASTYQRLDKMVSNLLASSTEYPNSNAVLAKLALKADAANPVFTGDLTISGATPRLYFVDTDQNPDYTIFVDSGYFYIYDQTAGATKFQITPSGNAINAGTLTSTSFIKSGGTASQFLMADGSVSTFGGVTGSGTTGYLPRWTASNTLGDSVIYGTGSSVGINTNNPVLHSSSGGLVVKGSARGIIEIWDATSGKSVIQNVGGDTYMGQLDKGTGSGKTYLLVNGNGSSSDIALTLNADSTAIFAKTAAANHFISNSTDVGGEYYFFKGNGAVANNFTAYAYDNNVYLNAYNTIHLRANNTGGSGGTINLSGGNVLINTGSNAGFRLDVNGTGRFTDTITSQSNGSTFGTASAAGRAIIIQAGSGNQAIQLKNAAGGDGTIFATGTSTVMNYAFNTYSTGNAFYIQNNGNIGIGTASPRTSASGSNKTLDIKGGIYFGDTGSESCTINNDDSMIFNIDANNNGNTNFFRFATNTTQESGGTELMRITDGGKVGIGTDNPLALLHLQSTASSAQYIYSAGASNYASLSFLNTTTTYGYDIGFGGSSSIAPNSFYIYGGSSASVKFSITSSGIVQINQYAEIGKSVSASQFLTVSENQIFRTGGGELYINSSGTGNIRIGEGGGSLLVNTGTRWNQEKLGIQISNASAWSSVPSMMRLTNNIAGGNTKITFTDSNIIDGIFGMIPIGSASYFVMGFAGYTEQGFKLYQNGNLTIAGSVTATSFFESSDIRLKKLIDGSAQVSGIENLEAKLYEKNGKLEFGYFAQDAEKLMPYAVTKNADGFLTLSYREVHTAKIARLEKEVEMLKAQLNAA
jgi:hypothetical protein